MRRTGFVAIEQASGTSHDVARAVMLPVASGARLYLLTACVLQHMKIEAARGWLVAIVPTVVAGACGVIHVFKRLLKNCVALRTVVVIRVVCLGKVVSVVLVGVVLVGFVEHVCVTPKLLRRTPPLAERAFCGKSCEDGRVTS